MKHRYIPEIRSILLIATLVSSVLSAVAQQHQIRGKITSASDNSAIPGVTVVIKGSQTGTITNTEGQYEINAAQGQTLTFSFVGFKSQEVPVSSQTEINVILEEDITTLNEVVAIGYGSQSRQTLTTAVSKLDTRVLENTTFGNAASALQGTVSGVRVQTTSGQPGTAPRVIVRGGTSINNPNGAQPLYVVDGVIRNDLNGINALDIENMQVLKDAAATAIYGARASNGVVIVSLRKGAAGKTVINYNYSLSLSRLREKYELLNGGDFLYYGRLGIAASGEKTPARLDQLTTASPFGIGNDLSNSTAYTNQYLTDENRHKLNEGWKSIPDPLDPSKTIIYQDTDWQDELFRTGITQDHYLTFSGGTEKATFNIGAGYTKIDGMAVTTGYKRFSANMNGQLQVKKNLIAYAGLNLSRSSSKTVFSESTIFERSIATAPTAKLNFEDGTPAPGSGRTLGNPFYYLSRTNSDNSSNMLTLNGGIRWNILPDLVFEPTASLYYKVDDANSFLMSYLNSPTQLIDLRDASGSYSKWDQKQFEATLSYDKSVDDHHFDAKLGLSYFDRSSRSLSASGNGAATDLIPTLNASATAVSVYSFATAQAIMGYFGRVNYDFRKTYLLSLSARYDGASNLGAQNRWGFFPGISAGWNVHNENFWNASSTVNFLKIRGSYGVNGNLGNLGDYQAQGQYSVGERYDQIAAVAYSIMANQSLRWEQSRTLDFGVDAGLLQNKIRITADFYRRETNDLITDLSLPLETGFTSIVTNLGSLENKGFELEINSNIIRGQHFDWNLSLNTSFNKNKILKLPENGNLNNRVGGFLVYDEATGENVWKGGLQEGGAVGDMYGYKQIGIYATDEEAAAGPLDQIVATSDKTKYGGDVNWLDANGDNIINTFDRVYMGNPFPKWTGGFTSNMTYKGIGLYIRLDYTTGHTIYNYVRANMNGQFIGNSNMTADLLRSWLNQGDQTDIPRFYWADQTAQSNYWRGDPRTASNGGGSSANYETGDYLALREVTLSYSLPPQILSVLKIANLSLNVTGNNLKYFTKYSGLAPEEGGIDRGRYPVPRIIMFGLKASF